MAFQVSLEERDRIGEELRQLANDLEKRVDERTAEVLGAKELAETALETLRQAQERLVQAEKMASLGNLVAGVAHELNTPLGNMLMVSTTLQAHIADFNNHVRQGTLQRSILDNFLNESLSATNILTREAEHAAELIGNFKQVAIDQSSLRRRKFDLGTVVKETLSSLHNKLKNTVINIEIDIPSGIIMDNHPGPIEQILTNFILNSLLHGFDEGQPGSIRIEARAQNGQLYFVYEDSGHGMNEESAKHAFDPFFTTKFGQGGSGLGLYIVYNLVTTVLMGRLTLSTGPGAGTRFDLNCPLDTPADVSSAALVKS
jgi:signal transduction histidine kinase